MKIKNIYEEEPKETKLQTAERWSYVLAGALGLTIVDYIQGGVGDAAIVCGALAVVIHSVFWCIKKNRSFEE